LSARKRRDDKEFTGDSGLVQKKNRKGELVSKDAD